MSKYDWSKVSEEANYVATDKDMVQVEFTEKPIICLNSGMWIDGTINGYHDYTHNDKLSDFKGDWKDSLEERPK
ncbi:hypothetical protein [Acinetobacter phage A2.1]|nr:hypothetical protein BphiR2919_00027 [Acinetobacter phage Bphi-R2919]QGH74141.1 hypothetical protein BphiR1888_00026 [Acinetobacter phage Bphi-R1888]WNT46310.1 hypothetical protein [Acinetobacter phage P711]WNT46392.1 hypothetical protein [Acinetobacter phage A2.1]